MKLKFEKVQTDKGLFGSPIYSYIAKQDGFRYSYQTDFGFGNLCKGSITTPAGFWMAFDTRNQGNKFLDTPQLMELWFQSHADGISKRNENSNVEPEARKA